MGIISFIFSNMYYTHGRNDNLIFLKTSYIPAWPMIKEIIKAFSPLGVLKPLALRKHLESTRRACGTA
jgi:hypothetical protein